MNRCMRVVAMVATVAALAAVLAGAAGDPADRLRKAHELYNDGNYAEAYAAFRELALEAETQADSALLRGLDCLNRLGHQHEMDAFREAVVEAHPDSVRVLRAAGRSYLDYTHYGTIIAGEFRRGPHRGGGEHANAFERDRVRALQLLHRALELAEETASDRVAADVCLELVRALEQGRSGPQAWRLQVRTDLTDLPDVDRGARRYRSYGGPARGAPVDAQGEPLFYDVPEGFDQAASDGERVRWLHVLAVERDPNKVNQVRWTRAEFLRGQFGVHTLAYFGRRIPGPVGEGETDEAASLFALHTLDEDETIARLATGPRRFVLPQGHNFLRLYQAVVENPRSGYIVQAEERLATLFENRRQYDKAAGWWERVRRHGGHWERRAREHLAQIRRPWGQFQPTDTHPAGRGAQVGFRYRNGDRVTLTAYEIRVRDLLADVKDYIRDKPDRVDHQEIEINRIGYRLVRQAETKYLGDKAAEWSLDLDPPAGHFDRHITVTTPLQEAGAYLLVARMRDGNTSRIVVWVNDTVLVKKPLDRGHWFYVADAVTGLPVADAQVDFFGFDTERVDRTNRYRVNIRETERTTGAQGTLQLEEDEITDDMRWLITATTDEGRLAYLGFSRIWYSTHHDRTYHARRVFLITDRPVYRPEQTVHYKFWVRNAQYDMPEESRFAGTTFPVELRDPRNEKVVDTSLKADAFGGMEGTYELPKDARLGVYRLYLPGYGGGNFRVEEYKKPEYEVTVSAPQEPVRLGEEFTATVKAEYYFGGPVTQATVHYKVLRTAHETRWYPPAPWDWLYGPGYWWFRPAYGWYPGWRAWGFVAPAPYWWPAHRDPPEVVAEGTAPLGSEGTLEIPLDTAPAKALHGDTDHRYEITAEVRDLSRRTIVGTGSVLVARRPFRVHVWMDRGHYRVGDKVRAHCAARRPDGKPVPGAAQAVLYRIGYDEDRNPVETAVQEWTVEANAQGRASLDLRASRAGQYRLSVTLTDAAGHEQEGGYVFLVRGEGFDGRAYRFNALELVPDRREYRPGDAARLAVNTDRAGAAVFLFLRPTDGVYLVPKLVRLQGKSHLETIEIVKRDMPNVYVEALTVADGEVHTVVRELVVPPQKRVLDVAVEPSAQEYEPGEEARVRLRVTDASGEPVAGSVVLAVYDKAVEYISGGSNVADIRNHFWSWRRHHRPRTESSLARWFAEVLRKDETAMRSIGVFGGLPGPEALTTDTGGARLAGNRPREESRLRRRLGAPGAMPEGEMMFAAKSEAADAVMAEPAPAPARSAEAPAGGEGQAGPEPTVRRAFADTALWAGALSTGADGRTEATFPMPENLTTWKVKAWAMGHGTRVGQAATEVITTKPLLVRLQAPRFFVEKDEAVLSAVVHNDFDADQPVRASLALGGEVLELLPAHGAQERQITVPAHGQARVDWRVRVVAQGEAVVRMSARAPEAADAMEMRFPAHVHGMERQESRSGALRPDEDEQSTTFEVPAARRPETARLVVRYSPTLAGAMLDALPYLASYPYGCTEQTLNRFLPTVLTQKVLQDMGVDLAAVRDKRANLNAQELGDPQERAAGWRRYEDNPVFDKARVDDMVATGVRDLTNMQLSDGGWGWFSGYGEHSSPHTTALVVHGLQVARANDVRVEDQVLDRGVQWLTRHEAEQVELLKNAAKDDKTGLRWKSHADATDALVYRVLADADRENADMRAFLYRDRTHVSVYGKALAALAFHKQGHHDQRDMLIRNIEQYLVQDPENQTAYLDLPNGGYWWFWYGSEIEAHAAYLQLLSHVAPESRRAARVVKYLLNNRKHATYWNSTRDTALCVEAFAHFLRASGEAAPDLTVRVAVDGRVRKTVRITPETLFTYDDRLVLAGEELSTGRHTVTLHRRGDGPLYWNAYFKYFSLEDPIRKAGLEIRVTRDYYRLNRVDAQAHVAGARGQAVAQRVEKYERERLENLEAVTSGQLVEVELVIESKNDYEYLVFEDPKPAGFEPVALRSGYGGRGLPAYRELRDDRVTFFVRRLARGRHSVSYRMRAEVPGRFSALPTVGYAMYAPELKGNSDEIKLVVED